MNLNVKCAVRAGAACKAVVNVFEGRLQFWTEPGQHGAGFVRGMVALILLACSAQGATWYVDSGATGLNNGTSWANAWTSLSSASGSGVAAGDTVYISGGPSGSSRTYSASSWNPKQGTSSSRITYQIGQDAAHNGTAIFNGTGPFFGSGLNNLVFSGYVTNDPALHFQLSGYSAASGERSVSNFRFCYVNMGSINPGAAEVFLFDTYANLELDHLWCYVSGTTADAWCALVTAGTSSWDAAMIHDCIIYIPVASVSDPWGADGVRWGGQGNGGVSVYNCQMYGYFNGYNGIQHQDGCQCMAGPYNKIYNNYFYGLGNSAINVAPVFSALTFTYVYNNIAVACHDFGIYMDVESDDDYFTMENCILANNLCEPSSSSFYDMLFGNYDGTPGTYSNNLVANNIIVNRTTQAGNPGAIASAGSATEEDTVFLTTSQAAAYFTSYTAGTTNSNFHLQSAATALIGQGANLSASFTIDKDGIIRPSTGAWDIGPYQYATPDTNPIIQVLPASLNFGAVPTGASATNSFTVQNVSGGILAGTATVPAPFSIVSGGTYSLGNNQTGTVSVSYSASGTNASQVVTFTGGGGATATVSGVPGTRAKLQIRVTPTGQVILDATGSAGQSYDILCAPGLGSWTNLGTMTLGTNGAAEFIDSAAPGQPSRFYRLRWE
jgi:hypothetical protein